MACRVFRGFHHQPGHRRAAMDRYIGAVEGNGPATDNASEAVRRGDGWAGRR